MRTYLTGKADRRPISFEIDNVYVTRAQVARVLESVLNVSDVQQAGRFGSSNDVRVSFRYHGTDYVVWEPYGDNSRYWIGPKEPRDDSPAIEPIRQAFDRYQPPLLRRILGDLMTLRFLRKHVE